jgi:hypothetical protein
VQALYGNITGGIDRFVTFRLSLINFCFKIFTPTDEFTRIETIRTNLKILLNIIFTHELLQLLNYTILVGDFERGVSRDFILYIR